MANKQDLKAHVNRQMIPENGIHITQLVVRPIQRISQDIGKWRAALKQAEAINGTRVALYDLYEDIMLDATLSSLVEKRILGVTKYELQFVDKDGEVVPDLNNLLRSISMRDLRAEILKYKFWGISVIELLKEADKLKIYSTPRKHIKPKEGIITKEQYDQTGLFYRNPPACNYIVEIGRYDSLGLLLKAAPYVIYKRGGFGDWSQYAEIFGMPFRKGKYDGYNQDAKRQLLEALEQMGGAGYAAIPNETDIEIIENKGTQGSSDLYNALRGACNEELAVLVLGQTETTTKTAGKLGGNDATHEHTEDAINMADREDELAIFNELVKPILLNLGYSVKDGQFRHKPEDEKLSMKDKVDVLVKLKNELDLPIDDDHIYEETGVPKPKDYEAQKKEKLVAKTQQAATLSNKILKPENKPVSATIKPNKSTEPTSLSVMERFRAFMADFFDQALKD